jgi:hypothetical protein
MKQADGSEGFRLKRGVFFARVDGEGILLDLRSNRYIALDQSATAIWQYLAGDTPLEASAGDVARQVELWKRAGLVVPAAQPDAVPLPRAKELGTSASLHLDPGAARVSTTGALQLLRAQWWRRRSLERRGLCQTLYHLQREARAPREAVSDEAVARVVRTLRAMRLPFRLGSEDCLARSIDLARALSQQGIESDVCFGVVRFPFLAHAWVEREGRVLSEPTSRVPRFTLLARF